MYGSDEQSGNRSVFWECGGWVGRKLPVKIGIKKAKWYLFALMGKVSVSFETFLKIV